ncbi:MAG: hypothetical protein R3C53_26615 [Pirellulaceae bacterium]
MDNVKLDLNRDREAAESSTVAKTVAESIVGEDEPMDVKHPRAPGALVWFAYPLVLVVAILVLTGLIAFFYR